MATVGDQLLNPESGWKRYDDTNNLIEYKGGWVQSTNTSNYNSTTWYSNINGNKFSFKFYGTKTRFIAPCNNGYDSNITVTIDEIPYIYSQYGSFTSNIFQIVVFEALGLTEGVHEVSVTVENGLYVSLDAIDIDADGRLLHPTLEEVFDPKDLDTGRCIRCHYIASSNQVGIFNGLGEETSDIISPESSATPDGDFYWICVGYDYLGRKKLIADRNIQHSISWDSINSVGGVNGLGLDYNIELPVTSVYKMDETSGTILHDITGKHDGTINGATLTGNGLCFDGVDDYVEFSDPVIPIGKKSIGFKVKLPTSVGEFHWILSNDLNNSSEYGTRIYVQGGKIGFDVLVGVINYFPISVLSDLTINDNIWHDVLITWDGTTNADGIKMYIDDMGTPHKTGKAEEQETLTPSTNLVLGFGSGFNDLQERHFIGELANLEIYNDVINLQSILESDKYKYSTRLMNGGVSSTDKDNEWDKIIVENDLGGFITPGDDNIWCWKDCWSWGSTTSVEISGVATIGSSGRVILGDEQFDLGISGYNNWETNNFNMYGGYRPVLLIETLWQSLYVISDAEENVFDKALVNIGRLPMTGDMYQNGYDSLSEIDWKAVKTLPQPIKLWEWTDNADITVTNRKVEILPNDQFLAANNDFDISNVEHILSAVASCNVSGSGVVKIYVSVNAGQTWQGYNGTAWGPVTIIRAYDSDGNIIGVVNEEEVKTKGMVPTLFNGLTETEWDALGVPSANTIRFAYYFSQEGSEDVANIDSMSLKIKLQGALEKANHMVDYKLEIPSNKILRVTILEDGDYVITHVK